MLRVRLAVLFGCPVWMVGELVPASELPIWRAHFAAEPWGFNAQDMLASKTAHQIGQVSGRVKPGSSYTDFMFKDKFDSGDLCKEEFELLSEQEQKIYVERQIRAAQLVLN